MPLRAAQIRALGDLMDSRGVISLQVVGVQTVTDRKDLICLYWGVFTSTAE